MSEIESGTSGADRFDEVVTADAVVVGAGIAGLSAALALSPLKVHVLTKGRFGHCGSSAWAQGGIAAAVAADDSPKLHLDDTLLAGAGLADPEAVELLTREGPGRVLSLLALGVSFDRRGDGALALGREAAHSRRRILHADGDATGREVIRGLAEAARATASIEVDEDTFAWDLVVEGGRVVGLTAIGPDGRRILYCTSAVILATGGVGRVYSKTTNPVEVTGDGLAMAARAGARLVDIEFVQFHPTALASGADPMPLVTEAVRGEGATLIDAAGRRFMPAIHPDAELAPRDVVARASWERLDAGVFLDAREAVGERFPQRFPTVYASCIASGIDPQVDPIPVSPAAHYHMGGVEVDLYGRTSLDGLWACGEAASTGVHGANRLASNSLLEGLVFGARVAENLRTRRTSPIRVARSPELPPEGASRRPTTTAGAKQIDELRELMWRHVGLIRDGDGMEAALQSIDRIRREAIDQTSRDSASSVLEMGGEGRNLLLTARLITAAALARTESRGGHYRTDYPEADDAWRLRQRVVLDGAGDPLFDSVDLMGDEVEVGVRR